MSQIFEGPTKTFYVEPNPHLQMGHSAGGTKDKVLTGHIQAVTESQTHTEKECVSPPMGLTAKTHGECSFKAPGFKCDGREWGAEIHRPSASTQITWSVRLAGGRLSALSRWMS